MTKKNTDKVNPFDYLNAINSGKDIITDADDPILAEDGYVPYMTNKGLSYHLDSVMAANEMNIRHDLPKKLQYLYFLYTLKPRKRISKWYKPEPRPDIENLQAIYPMNDRQAEIALSLLTDEQRQIIQDISTIGVDSDGPNHSNVG